MSNVFKIIHFQRLLNFPELNIGIFSFLLNFFWETQQMPFFQISSEFSYFDTIKNCTFATVGDIGISLTAFWVIAVASKSRQWFRSAHWWQLSGFVVIGVVITATFEALAIKVLNLWEYADIMPILPFFSTGLLPLLQWLLIPPMIIWFVKRQLSDFRPRSSF